MLYNFRKKNFALWGLCKKLLFRLDLKWIGLHFWGCSTTFPIEVSVYGADEKSCFFRLELKWPKITFFGLKSKSNFSEEVSQRKVSESKVVLFFYFVKGGARKSKILHFSHFCQFLKALDLVFFQFLSFFIFLVILKAICLLNKDMTSKEKWS